MQTKVGIWELKTQLSAYLRQVKRGATVIITERGRPIGHIVPISRTTEDQLEALAEAGLIAWDGEKLDPLAPVAEVTGASTVADLFLKDREWSSIWMLLCW